MTWRSWRVEPTGTMTGRGRPAPRHPHTLVTPSAPAPTPARGGSAFSSRSALYRYYKSIGRLREYFAMFGIDYRPD
jgi:hypothetical protein